MFEINQKQLAQLLGISTRQVRNLKEDGLFELMSNSRKYYAPKCVQEYLEFKIKAETGRGTNLTKEKEQAEHERYKKELTLEKLRAIRKQTHKAKDVEEFLTNMLVNFRNHLLSVPAKVAPLIVGETDVNVIVKNLEQEMFASLDELAQYDPDKINGDEVNIYLNEADEDEDEESENN